MQVPSQHGPVTPQFRVSVEQTVPRARVRLRGELDLATAREVDATLGRLRLPAQTPIDVDLSDLLFCDAAGLTALLASHRSLTEAGHQVSWSGATSRVQRLFDLTGISAVLGPQPQSRSTTTDRLPREG